MKNEQKYIRNSNIELLRIIAAIGVIILHYNNKQMGGGFQYVEMHSVNSYIMYFLENIFVCAVNVFLLISGYFMCEQKSAKIIKVVELLFQVVVFNVVILLLKIFSRMVTGTAMLSWKECLAGILPINYYVTLYIVVYLLSPYTNLLLKNLTNLTFKTLVIFLFFVCSIWPTIVEFVELFINGNLGGMNTIGIEGSQDGYTIVNFLFMYIIGAYLRRLQVYKKSLYYLIRLIICWMIQFICSYMLDVLEVGADIIWAYCNPLVILSAIYSFLFFNSLKKIKNRWINTLAKASFSTYLFHMVFIPRIGIEFFVKGNVIFYIGHVFISCIGIYIISFIVYKIYNMFSKKIFHFMQKFIRFPEITI